MNLFLTDAWQNAWWRSWGGTRGFESVARQEKGYSGLYLDHYRYKGILPVRCLQFVGTNYRRISTPRTEYNLINTNAIPLLLELDWTEAVFADLVESSKEISKVLDFATASGCCVRYVARDTAYSVDTSGDFEGYLEGLGSGTRLRLFNRRTVLEKCGDIAIDNLWPENVGRFFELLNGFHLQRWHEPCFSNTSILFHRDFLNRIVHEGGWPDLSVLSVSGRPVSVLYNVVYQNVTYNLQAGFVEHFHKKLALGTLHLGYSIEAAFENDDVATFDLLAGGGKNEDYKAKLATDRTPLVSLMLVRSRLFKLLYRIKDLR